MPVLDDIKDDIKLVNEQINKDKRFAAQAVAAKDAMIAELKLQQRRVEALKAQGVTSSNDKGNVIQVLSNQQTTARQTIQPGSKENRILTPADSIAYFGGKIDAVNEKRAQAAKNVFADKGIELNNEEKLALEGKAPLNKNVKASKKEIKDATRSITTGVASVVAVAEAEQDVASANNVKQASASQTPGNVSFVDVVSAVQILEIAARAAAGQAAHRLVYTAASKGSLSAEDLYKYQKEAAKAELAHRELVREFKNSDFSSFSKDGFNSTLRTLVGKTVGEDNEELIAKLMTRQANTATKLNKINLSAFDLFIGVAQVTGQKFTPPADKKVLDDRHGYGFVNQSTKLKHPLQKF